MESPRHSPPTLARKLLIRFLRDDLAEEVAGDLDENYIKQLKTSPRYRANLNYWYQVFNYIRPFAIRTANSRFTANRYTMFQNYVKIGWRSLLKQRMYSAVKVGGLALGIAACLLIALFIRDELSFDRQVPDGDRIYRVIGVLEREGEKLKTVHFPAPFGPALKADYPDVEMSARYNSISLFGAGAKEIRRADREDNSYEEGFVFADPELLVMLQVPMVYGNRDQALTKPLSMVITRQKAEKYFPNEDPIGKMFILNDDEKKIYTVGGVIENFTAASHLNFDFLITLVEIDFYEGEQTNWGASNYPTYVKLSPGIDPVDLGKKMTKGTIEKYFLPSMLEQGQVDAMEMMKNAHLELQPLYDIHLYSEGMGDGLSPGDIRFIWLFGSIAAFILMIACINFINLSTARSANRAKEVGLRKVVGSFRSSLINQFLTESMIFSVLSFIIGITLTWLLLPYFNLLSAKSLVFPWQSWWILPLGLATVLLVGIVAGLYPSFYLSSFKPIEVLKGNLSLGSKSSGTRSALVVFQFTTSIVLIVGTVIIQRQMQFILNKKIGFEKDQVLIIQGAKSFKPEQLETFKNELLNISQVKSLTVGDYLPVAGNKRNGNPFYKEGKSRTDVGVQGQRWRVDHDYIKTMGMKIVEGRDFSEELDRLKPIPLTGKYLLQKTENADSAGAAIINQQMVKELGLTDPIGQGIENGWEHFIVVGVVEDFNFESMKQKIEPVCMAVTTMSRNPGNILVKLGSAKMSDAIESISAKWKEFAPHQPIRYAFLDDQYRRTYDDVQRMGGIFTSFAVLAIIVACLGLFALSAFMVEQRGKEISIRIVLGAPLNNIFRLLTQNFLILVTISILLATPIAWYLMTEWLKDFAYRIDLTWDVFLLAGLLAIAIALLTISYQSVKAALINPVNNLRSE